ncbi:glycosyltransferase [Paenibacillus antri]|uniref:Glycosyltransferase n=1 Tax=Paenibacillus antri TaxID=2582848 RepID=A0A5R9G7J9_9BACL|nr:glycosyltransferase [Paenibacillus antri]TLS49408.1 glycosyltransferase [Paenibacillus antri]
MKRLLFVAKCESIGGLEKTLSAYTGMLNTGEYEITVMTGQYNPSLRDMLPKEVNYKALFRRRFKGLDRILMHAPRSLLHRWYIRERYDVEISFQEGYPTKIVSGANSRTKKLIWFHNDPAYHDFNLSFIPDKAKLRETIRTYDALVAVSESIKKAYAAYMQLPDMTVIYNPIDVPFLIDCSKQNVEEDLKEGIFRLCCVGRLSEEKQYDMLVDCVVDLLREGENVELLIIGEGSLYDDLKRKIDNSNVQDAIKLLGFKSNPYPYVAKSSLLVCCSRTESFGLVVAEALALGVPVVATRCGGPEEILGQGEYGLLTDNNKTSLLAGLKRMIRDPELYATYRKSCAEAVKKFEKQKILREIENLF